MTSMLEPKRLGLLRELVPQAATLGVLLNPNFPSAVGQYLKTAKSLGLDMPSTLLTLADEVIE
jgi:hypothetical protein